MSLGLMSFRAERRQMLMMQTLEKVVRSVHIFVLLVSRRVPRYSRLTVHQEEKQG